MQTKVKTEVKNQRSDDSSVVLYLENRELKIIILPEMGGKILQIIHKSSGTCFLRKSPVDLSTICKPEYKDNFLPPYAAGFDDCFPTVGASRYLFKNKEITLPDHGELWTRSWDYSSKDAGVLLWTEGRRIDYRIRKELRLEGTKIKLSYELENLEPVSFDYIWSAHPLLDIEAGDVFLMPGEINHLLLDSSSDPSLGDTGDRLSWPYIFDDSKRNFSVVQSKSLDLSIKGFTPRLKNGQLGIYKKQADLSLIFSFDVNKIPYSGIWLCYGAWPKDAAENQKEYTVALEPCTGRPDSLQQACDRNEQQRIDPLSTQTWQLDIEIIDGKAHIR